MRGSFYTDNQLILAIKSNDHAEQNTALRQLYMDQVITLKIREFIKLYGTKQDEDDIMQEGILLMRRLIREDKFAGQSKVRTFLLGICRNLVRNDLKKVHRIELKADFSQFDNSLIETIDQHIFLEEQTIAEVKRTAIIKDLLGQLTEKCAQSLNLKYYKDQSMTQIAEARGLKNANQAKKAVDRCRQQLRKLIEKQPALVSFLKETL